MTSTAVTQAHAPPLLRVWAQRVLIAVPTLFFVGWSAFYLLTTVCAIINFAFRQPMFDQWRMYESFLGLPFPENLLQLENGHRPIVPNLFRIAEIQWFSANQLVQISVGTACALLTWFAFAATAWRQRELPLPARAAGVLVATIGVLWLANARMLLHGTESLDTYLLTLAVACAALCTYRAHERRSFAYFAAATGACVVAMFCFGSGVASFPAIVLLAFALRLPARWLLLPAIVLAVCLTAYLYVLPGSNGTHGFGELHPLDSALAAVRWISAPLVHAWLGHADPPLDTAMTGGMLRTDFGPTVVDSANWLQAASGIDWRTLATLFSAAAVLAFAIRFVLLLRAPRRVKRLHAFACAFCLFALATAAVIGIGRLTYFEEHPDQLYADRYLVWPCLFWTGLALLLLGDLARARKAAIPFLLIACALPLFALPMQQVSAMWSGLVFKMSQRVAASARSGVFDAEIYPDGADASRANVLDSLERFRQRHLAMFADSAWERLGTHCAVEQNNAIEVEFKVAAVFADALTGLPAARFEGRVLDGMARIAREDRLAILDDDDTIVGFAEFSYIADDEDALRLRTPRKRGFDGYVRGYAAGQRYRLVLLHEGRDAATMIRIVDPG